MTEPPITTWSDEELMQRAQGSEPHRLGDLVRRYRVRLLRTAHSRLGSVAAAEDAVQETFLAAFRSRHTFNPRFTVRTWLWTILLNVCKSFWQRRMRSPTQESWGDSGQGFGAAADVPHAAPGPVEHLLAKERSERLHHEISRLREEWADSVRLRFFADMKFQEIADVMACSLATAKNRVRWGLEQLATALGDDRGPHAIANANANESPHKHKDPSAWEG